MAEQRADFFLFSGRDGRNFFISFRSLCKMLVMIHLFHFVFGLNNMKTSEVGSSEGKKWGGKPRRLVSIKTHRWRKMSKGQLVTALASSLPLPLKSSLDVLCLYKETPSVSSGMDVHFYLGKDSAFDDGNKKRPCTKNPVGKVIFNVTRQNKWK